MRGVPSPDELFPDGMPEGMIALEGTGGEELLAQFGVLGVINADNLIHALAAHIAAAVTKAAVTDGADVDTAWTQARDEAVEHLDLVLSHVRPEAEGVVSKLSATPYN